MQTFTNKFSIALNQDKTEVMINFFQNVPTLPETNMTPAEAESISSVIVPVANLVMTGQCAKTLVDVLSDLLNLER